MAVTRVTSTEKYQEAIHEAYNLVDKIEDPDLKVAVSDTLKSMFRLIAAVNQDCIDYANGFSTGEFHRSIEDLLAGFDE